MKYMLADIYRFIYQLFKKRVIAGFIAAAYISLLTYFVLDGLVALLDEPVQVLALFSFPIGLALMLVLFVFFSWLMPSHHFMIKEKNHKARPLQIILFTMIAIISFLYVHFQQQLTF